MTNTSTEVDTEILVVGTGIAGIGLAIKLREHGFQDFTVLEKADDIGGTWRDHIYPGLTVDIPCFIYQYSFELNPKWSSVFAPQKEILAYLHHCVDKYDVRPHIRFNEEVLDASYDEDRNLWLTRLRGGRTITSRYLISGSGFFPISRMPDIEGLSEFQGQVLHSAHWPKDVNLRGKRIGLIGTGSTSVQLAPEVAALAEQMHVFQRTPIWVLPKPDVKLSPTMQRLLARVPGLHRLMRLATGAFMDLGFYSVYTKYPKAKKLSQMAEKKSYEYLREAVEDPALHDVLTPKYTWGCKRPTFSNGYYQMYNRDNVELVTDKILRVEPDAVVTVDGTRRPVDVLICATGYRPFEKETIPTYPVNGKDGVDIRDYWDSARYQAFRGFAVHQYPNFFLLYGPYAVNGSSYFTLHEVAVRNILRCLTAARKRGADYVEVTPKAQARDFAAVLSRQPQSIFHGGTCAAANTIYIDRFGDTPYFGPWTHPTTWLRSKLLSMKNFTLRRHKPSVTTAGPAPVLSAD